MLLGDHRHVWPKCVVERLLQIVSDNRCVMLEKINTQAIEIVVCEYNEIALLNNDGSPSRFFVRC